MARAALILLALMVFVRWGILKERVVVGASALPGTGFCDPITAPLCISLDISFPETIHHAYGFFPEKARHEPIVRRIQKIGTPKAQRVRQCRNVNVPISADRY